MAALSRDVSVGTHVGTQAVTSASTKGKALQIAIAIAQVNDQKAAQYFAVAMAGLVVLFSTHHWSRYIYNRYASKRVGDAHMIKRPAMVARYIDTTLTLNPSILMNIEGVLDVLLQTACLDSRPPATFFLS